ncbi:MAG: RNA methyltransferase [Anaerolineales bacterium]|nr:RNA methyltransferase [Anaerolineales bacterium]
MITSAQNPKLKLIRTLQGRPKGRHEHGVFVVDGVRLIEEALQAGWPFRFVLTSESLNERGQVLTAQLNAKGVDVEPVLEQLMKSISEMKTPQGVLAVLEQQILPLPARLDFALILDSIHDPGNMGTLIRTAAAAGVQAVFLSPETTDAFAPKVVRSGMGAHFRLPVLSLSWDEIKKSTNDLHIFLADMNGEIPCWQADLRKPLALIIGGEAQGVTAQANRLADQTIKIPMPGEVESLNAGVAGSILMFEVVRQRELLSRGR